MKTNKVNKEFTERQILALGEDLRISGYDYVTRLKILRAVNSYEVLLAQLKKSQEELKLELQEQGGCDHSVGICACPLIGLLEDNQAVITQAEGK